MLGRPSTLRRAITIALMVLFEAWVAYVKVDHASRSREDPVAPDRQVTLPGVRSSDVDERSVSENKSA